MCKRWCVVLWMCLSLNAFALQAADEDYPPPPTGITWGWQNNVTFPLNSAKLQKVALPVLDNLVYTLRQYPSVNLLITGRADNTGEENYNSQLSRKRATVVEQYLIKQGVNPSQLSKQEIGEQRPVASDACAEDRQRNRRVDLAFFPQGYLPDYVKPFQGDTKPQAGECEEVKEMERFIHSH
ncbi:OmpA family protein [Beggiatoa leptomitoformis]|uniref:OmpA family protein n=1 Tax=Beggiatoa leptomitoformis TaxID=288004 RepID=A0A2N9YD72_9GAMM|nr:OmpA family protein [Beggiatoa leptomitoformis]AUI68386.1 OmpA family protein [Beggiatoa leptomitoformis]QGX03859.1 OmpA family protein [Beggiatoa leptomitoformis]